MSDYTDTDRREFLDALDAAAFTVSDWESQFIESNIARQNFSEAQRRVIDRMIEKYEGRVKW